MSDETVRPDDAETASDQPVSGITDAEVEEVRRFIGQPLRIQQWNHEATYDTIRHWCFGIGDDNPLWTDEHHAAAGPYGVQVAPPSFVFSVFGPTIRPGLAGYPSLQGGGRLDVNRYVRRGERLLAEARLVDAEAKASKRAGRILVTTGETIYRTDHGEVIATYQSRGIRTQPPTGSVRLHEPREPREHTPIELAAIEREVLAARRTGTDRRVGVSVHTGDIVPTVVKGPLDSASMIAFYSGNGPGTYVPTDLRIRQRRAILDDPANGPNNAPVSTGLTHGPGGHDEPGAAHATGMPGAFDIGWQRIAWMIQALTDWAGDEGRLAMIDVRLVRPNVAGDVLRCGGTVVGSAADGDRCVIELAVEARTLDGELSANGTAKITLPAH